ncbi:hypothetical protein BX666DRAFT_1528922 [Dichotomocladium elegans]|nr:hypothetical protein BX666DRAFT_1528922 [Dichotomocladium elegans]
MIPPGKPLYIRARRNKTVVFLCYDSTDNVASLKQKLCAAIPNCDKTPQQVRFYIRRPDGSGYVPLNETDSVTSAGVQNETDLYYTFNNQGTWEEIHTAEYEPLDEIGEEIEEAMPSTKREKGKGRA